MHDRQLFPKITDKLLGISLSLYIYIYIDIDNLCGLNFKKKPPQRLLKNEISGQHCIRDTLHFEGQNRGFKLKPYYKKWWQIVANFDHVQGGCCTLVSKP